MRSLTERDLLERMMHQDKRYYGPLSMYKEWLVKRNRTTPRSPKRTVVKGSAGKIMDYNDNVWKNDAAWVDDALPNQPILPITTKKCESDIPQLFPTPEKASASILLIRKAKELSDQGKSLPIIANEMGKDEDWVHASLLIATKLPPSVHNAIATSKFSRTAALQLLLVNKDKLNEVVDGALKIAEVEGKL